MNNPPGPGAFKPPGTPHRNGRRRWLLGTFGTTFGLACLWIVYTYFDLHEASTVLFAAKSGWLIVSLGLFWFSLAARILRWRKLMAHLGKIRMGQVAEALVVGYAMNYVLPARLGEPFRADYTQRRFGLDRFAVFGSIMTERLLDGLLTVFLLIAGLISVSLGSSAGALSSFVSAAGIALFIFIIIALVLIGARRWPESVPRGPAWFAGPLRRLMFGATRLSSQNLVAAISWTAIVWLFESLALWALLRSLNVLVAPAELMVLLGGSAVSALAITAPANIGSLQLVFALILAAFALPAASGVAAATLVQVVLYGSLILAAAGVWVPRWFRSVIAQTGK